MQTPIIIYGSRGRVGSQLLRYIYELVDRPFRVVGLIESDSYCIDPDGMTGHDINYQTWMIDIETALGAFDGRQGIIIDATAAKDPLRDIHMHIIRQTPHAIVTANKNPLSLYGVEIFDQLTHDIKRYSANTTLMAGAGALPFLQDRMATGDEVSSVQGIFSGTLGYIFSTFEKGEKTFSQVVREAYENGYTEPHPYDDLNGLDVARKLLIVARTLGHKVELSDIEITPLVEEGIYDENVEVFLKNCESLDEHYETLRVSAADTWNVLRYVASYSKDGQLNVALARQDNAGPLGRLSGTHNIIVIETSSYQYPYPHIIISRWAGLEVTAYGLLAQILRVYATTHNS